MAKSRVRNVAKSVLEAVHSKDKAVAEEKFLLFVKSIDTVARKGIIKTTTAARKKSRLHKLLNSMSAAQ
jgi:small subunit ribosomal protein S20